VKPNQANISELFTPRSLGIVSLQYFASVPLVPAIMMLSIIIISGSPIAYDDLLPLSAMIIPPLLAAFLMLYVPQKYRCRILFDNDSKLLNIKKKGAEPLNFDLYKAKAIISKIIFTRPSFKYFLLTENDSDYSQIVFEEDTPFGARHWEAFSERLSAVTSLPLRKEYFSEQLDGTLLRKSAAERTVDRKHGLIIISIPIIFSFIGAAIYKCYPLPKVFILSGVATVAFNLLLSFLYGLLNRNVLGDWGKNNFKLLIYVLSLLMPFALFYIFFIMVLNGFRWPLSN